MGFAAQVVVETQEVTVLIDDGDVIPGVELALKSMKNKEEATFLIAPKHAYGAQGEASLNVPPNATLKASIKVCCARSRGRRRRGQGGVPCPAAAWR
jgi:FKBP-type peptidyl-prolyl cis-trans isomerase 2